MVTQLAIAGVESRVSVEAAIDRWIARLERARPLSGCSVSLTIESHLLGRKSARLELAIRYDGAEVTISRAARLREPGELYALIADGFRDAYHKIEERPSRPAAHPMHLIDACACRPYRPT
jgi:hypothetical protein